MKKISVLIPILILGMMFTACQQNPAAITDVEETAEGVNTESPAAAEELGGSAVADFYQPAAGEEQPQLKLFTMPPALIDYISPVTVICNDTSATVNTIDQGVWINNHCIIDTGMTRAQVVMPDGSVVSLDAKTVAQVNVFDDSTEIILKQGEVYAIVPPQDDGERFSITAGDTVFEAAGVVWESIGKAGKNVLAAPSKAAQNEGTTYGVHLKDELINVVVIYGNVYTHRCINWKLHTCMKWQQLSVEMAPTNVYTVEVGGTDWTNFELLDPYRWFENEAIDMPLSKNEYLASSNLYFYDLNDQQNYEFAMQYMKERIFWDIMTVTNVTIEEYNQTVDQLNQQAGSFCVLNPVACPLIPLPMVETTAPEAPAVPDSNSGPSGKFPPFDHGSCFNRGGHYWCYPVTGSVDVSMSGEWDITAICTSYPGETFCAWLK